jgi:hypothetical protein
MSIQRPLGSLLITAPTGSHPVSLTAILYFQGDKKPNGWFVANLRFWDYPVQTGIRFFHRQGPTRVCHL